MMRKIELNLLKICSRKLEVPVLWFVWHIFTLKVWEVSDKNVSHVLWKNNKENLSIIIYLFHPYLKHLYVTNIYLINKLEKKVWQKVSHTPKVWHVRLFTPESQLEPLMVKSTWIRLRIIYYKLSHSLKAPKLEKAS